MASSNEVSTLPTAECRTVDIEATKSRPTQLCMTMTEAAQSPITAIERTLRYAKNPKEYLLKVLGVSTFEERKEMLCIPDKIDRDFYGKGSHKSNFEHHIAKLLGKQQGLFFITGVQAQLAALVVYCDRIPNYRVAWHVSSHLESAEEESYQHLYKLKRILLGNAPEELPTVEEIKEILCRPESCRPAAIVLEIPNRTLGCKTYTFEELETISNECRKSNVKLHCDGARLWEIEPYYQATAGKTFADIGALFDSLYVSFYKGLGGNAGAMLVSNDSELIDQSKVWQRRAGGNVCTLFYQITDCERGFNENIGAFAARRKKMMQIVEGVTKATSGFTTKDGLPYVQFVPETPTCCQIHTVFEGFTADQLVAARDNVEERTNVRVFEKLRSKQTVDQSMKGERQSQGTGNSKPEAVSEKSMDLRHFMEWLIMETTQKIETQVFVEGYVALCEELAATASSAD